MRKLPLFALTSAICLSAAQPDYFPLRAGNEWVLQSNGATPEILNVEVLRSRVSGGETWFLVSGYAPEPLWLHRSTDGALLTVDPKSGGELTVASFAANAGRYTTFLGGCEQTAGTIEAASAYAGANFDFKTALTIGYQPLACRDAGLETEIYAPGVGLVRRSITTLRGAITFDLIYARVNGASVLGRSKQVVLAHDFDHGGKGWLPGFTDYDLRTADLRMIAELRPLPDEVDPNRFAYYLHSMNRSDDLFMFLKREVSGADGVEPNAVYRVEYDIRLASNAPAGCIGTGGSPGESVYLKAGATTDEPLATLDGRYVRLSVDKGQQATGGQHAGVVGNLANGNPCEGSPQYATVRRTYTHPWVVQTDERGSMWLLIGADSAYEGLTAFYVESVVVRIQPLR